MTVDYSVILVDSTSHALRIEKMMNTEGLASKLIPVPRHLSSDCGVCVRIGREDMEKVKRLLVDNGIVIQSIEVI